MYEDEAQEDHKSHSDLQEAFDGQSRHREEGEHHMAESTELHQDSTASAESGVLCSHHSLLEDPEEVQNSLDSPWEASRAACSREGVGSRSHSLYPLEVVEVVGSAHSHRGKDLSEADSQRRCRRKAVV